MRLVCAYVPAQRLDHCVFERIGWEEVGIAARNPVALPGEAAVIAVATAASMGSAADVAVTAAGTGQHPGEQVVGGIRGPLGAVQQRVWGRLAVAPPIRRTVRIRRFTHWQTGKTLSPISNFQAELG
jgi:hypothetical protein